MKIPFVDLKAQYDSIKTDIDSAIQNVINTTAFIGGPIVQNFEKEFASFAQVKHCIACANGTDSIEILLRSFGIKQGDEVIVPAISWISTSEAVSSVGAKPVFVDIDQYYTIDVTKIEEKITKATKAIIPVHLYGHPADMPAIMKIADKHKLIVIEDCAQSHDSEVGGKKAGTFGHAASFSFYPGKNLGAYGDAGCMTTNDDAIAAKSRMIANHGQLKKHDHQIEGRNSRLDTLQAAILSAKLPHLAKWTQQRIDNAAKYDKALADAGVVVPTTRSNTKPVYHLYVIRSDNREGLAAYLKEKGIETAVHYPTPLPFMKCYESYGHKPSDFPVAYAVKDKILSLPMYPELTTGLIEQVSIAVKDFSKK